MSVTRTSVHKLNGKPYYTWKQNKEDETWSTVAVDQSDNSLLGVIEEKDSFNFYYTIKLPKIEGEGQLWIPIAQNSQFQNIEIMDKYFPVSPKVLTDTVFGNKAFYITIREDYSNQEIQIKYAVKRLEKSPYASDSNEDLSKYLKSNTLIPVNERFKNIALTAIGEKTRDDTLMMARALYDYVIDSMKYIKDGKYGTGDAVYACDAQSGNCSEFHSYFIALARSIGIPARFGIGAAIPSNRNEGGVNGYHCWAEFYTNGEWWPVDISEANKYSNLATYYFGHHGANRIAFSQGRDITFDPLPASGPINFFAYPVMEVNGGVVRPEVEFSFLRP
jgi:transglutaminase-like putative cysteine protease